MAADEELFVSTDISLWRAALEVYSKVIEQKEAGRSQKSKRTGESLVELDNWYQQTLPEVISARDPPHLTHAELSKLMRWKLMRGKFRPRLTELVQQNKPEDVEKITREAIKAASRNLEVAMKQLCQLKAVGPATASAILCAACPQNAPFMADESVLSVPGLGKLDYTLKHYMNYASEIQQKAQDLNRAEGKSGSEPWTSHDVEKALWTYSLAPKFNVKIPSQSKSSDKKESHKDDEEQLPKAKRKKPNET